MTGPQTEQAPAPMTRPRQEEIFAWLQLTNRCNLTCSYCYTESGPHPDGGQLPLSTAKDIVADIAAAGGRAVMMSGGEPTLYPDLIELLNYTCGVHGLMVTLVTNGTYLRPELVDTLARHSCTVQVSLDAVHEKGYKEARGRGRLPQALRGVDSLLDAGITVTLSAALTTVNQQWVRDIVMYAIDRGIQFVHFAPTYWKDGGPFQRSLFIDDLYPVLRELYELQKQHYMFVSIDLVEHLVLPVALGIQRKYYCHAMAGRTVEIASDGGVYACAAQRDIPEMKLGQLDGERRLLPIIEVNRASGGFPKIGADTIPECKTCEYRYICAGGCRAMTYLQAGDLDLRHPNCADLKRFIADIKQDLESGQLTDYVDFLKSQEAIDQSGDALLKMF